MTVSDGIDYTEAALLADHAHSELVKALMDLVGVFDYVQGVEPGIEPATSCLQSIGRGSRAAIERSRWPRKIGRIAAVADSATLPPSPGWCTRS
jgi:hypothetical protein